MPSAQSQFAAEFITFLAAAAGLALVLLRSSLASRVAWGASLLAAGFFAVAAGAFLHGSLIIEETDDPRLVAIRAAGLLAIAAGATTWAAGRSSQRVLWCSTAILAVGAVAGALDVGMAADGTVAIGAAGLGVAVLSASRGAIAARVAASAAGSLLLVVLVLSLALSTVLANTVEDEAKTRLNARANQEATDIRDSVGDAAREANFASAFLVSTAENELVSQADGDPPNPLFNQLLRRFALDQTFSYAYFANVVTAPSATEIRPSASADTRNRNSDLPAALLVALARDKVLTSVRCGAPQTTLFPQGSEIVSIGAQPACKGGRLLGVVAALIFVDGAYLESQTRDDNSLSLAIVSRSGIVARYNEQPSDDVLRQLGTAALDDGKQHLRTTRGASGRYIAAQPVVGEQGAVVTLVASTSTDVVSSTREQLFRTLFLIALGGTLLALLLAAVVGDRIGSGVRRLTAAAESIQRGELAVRAGVSTEDEVGVLGTAFDSMAASIEEKTSALRQAASDEVRLRNRLEAVVAGMGEALLAVDSRGVVTDFNQAAEELTGVPASEARGRRADTVVRLVSDGDEGEDLSSRLRSPLARRWSSFANVVLPGDVLIPVEVSAGALRDLDGELAGGVFVLRDLRSEREVERMKNEFLAHIGHELRTPLTPLIGYAELVTRRGDQFSAEQVKVLMEEILSAARRLQRIIELLEFVASSGAGRLPLRPEQLNLRQLLDDTVERWSDRLDDKHELSRRLARGLPAVVADPRWISVSVDELLDNAVKFSPGGGKIAVSATVADNGSGPGVEIAVVDRGKGMTEEERAAAFGEFVQGDGSDTRQYGGLGLGLALVQRVAQAHGGTVKCESAPGKGSKFSIFLPAAPIEKVRR